MLSKWTKSSGSSSSPPPLPLHALLAALVGCVRACMPARTLSQPLSAELLLHSSAPYLLLWIFIWSRAALRACLRKDSRSDSHSARLNEAARSLYALQIAGFPGWGKQLQAIDSFIKGLSFVVAEPGCVQGRVCCIQGDRLDGLHVGCFVSLLSMC